MLAKSPAADVYAPGHNAFFTDRAGRSWIVYDANAGTGAGCTSKRSPRVQPMLAADGTPVFPAPARAGAPVPAPIP